jgi:uncharacterized protein
MKRDIYSHLLDWKESKDRKPLILSGARQVGKTYILKQFANDAYENHVYINFEQQKDTRSLFDSNLEPKRIIKDLSLASDIKIEPGKTLIILDEIQDCPNALTSLKYFNESANDYHVVTAGSLLGVMLGKERGYPVGKVNTLELFPLTFFEFLTANKKTALRDYLEKIKSNLMKPSDLIHNQLIELLGEYFITGGMPEAVKRYEETKDLHVVRDIQRELIRGYRSDFAKYASPSEAIKISSIWESLPAQLSRENKKFTFKEVSEKARAREYMSSVKWLTDAGLVYKLENCNKPLVPLNSYKNTNIFKLYFFDIGLLGALCNLEPKLSLDKEVLFRFYKGAITENYVVQEMFANGKKQIAYWTSAGNAEVDIICEFKSRIYPLEIKSGKRTKSKSLSVYVDQNCPPIASRTSKNNLTQDTNNCNYPLYLISKFPELSASIHL